jgi:hypothetical protein
MQSLTSVWDDEERERKFGEAAKRKRDGERVAQTTASCGPSILPTAWGKILNVLLATFIWRH